MTCVGLASVATRVDMLPCCDLGKNSELKVCSIRYYQPYIGYALKICVSLIDLFSFCENRC